MRLLFSLLLISSVAFGQSVVTQKDKNFANHIKRVWAKVNKSNYQNLFAELTKECDEYLKKNPDTVIKPGILGYVFEMKATIGKNSDEVTQAAEKLLKYDNSVKTNIRVAQVLIEKKIDDKKGIEVLQKILPSLKHGQQFYDAHLLLAAGEMHLKNYEGAMQSLNEAIKSDSSRIDGYKGLLDVMKKSGNTQNMVKVEKEIKKLDIDPNINVDISSLSLFDINKKEIKFSNFKGSVVVMVFFRFDCPYCKKDMPVLKKLIKKHPDVKFVFINLNETVSEINNRFLPMKEFSFLRDQTIIQFTNIFDKILDITITPQTLIVDKNLIVKYNYRGYQENFEQKFEDNLQALR